MSGLSEVWTFFLTFLDVNPKGAGILRPSDIPTALSVAVELLDAQMDPERYYFSFYHFMTESKYILGQKRNAAYKTYIVYGGLSPISRKRFVTV